MPRVPRLLRHAWAIAAILLTLVVDDRLIMLEAVQKGLITGSQPARKLQEQPEIIKGWREYTQSVQQIPRLGILVRPITSAIAKASEAIRVQEGLMTNDSVTVALVRKIGLRDIATADAAFDNVSHSRVYQPGRSSLEARQRLLATA